ncbi:conserved hypothetical protein [Desulfofarcimen acetoxidans DSM 771]|uniref:Mg2+ and Co2+ transporter CorB n=1 Tax=Desulfofarcimen acetoxidans (strain ATCC 49208 / DSM 771 / KCTC 5769 / VKM B-1644 / 5575) TaxID=485916 RepID=C8W0Y2_DESAS|nr:hypothetical protein [Desulfofarcimen acetoxidans]ACV63378.1 conserved hypothetical protein [Desulfofarcimen acetoxidans DSM 771]
MSNGRSSVSISYIIIIGIISFTLAVVFSLISETLTRKLNSLVVSFAILLVIILINILGDIIGVAVTAASEAPFHAKASKRVPGSQQGVNLIRNADKVANIGNDVVGDITGTVAGALGIALASQIYAYRHDWDQFVLNILLTGFIASITVSSKAIGKKYAIEHANEVIFSVGRIMAWWEGITGIKIGKKSRCSKQK